MIHFYSGFSLLNHPKKRKKHDSFVLHFAQNQWHQWALFQFWCCIQAHIHLCAWQACAPKVANGLRRLLETCNLQEMHWTPNPFYLCAGLCSPSHWWKGITQQQVQEQQTRREKHKGRDDAWYRGAEKTCNNLIYFFTSYHQSFEGNILHWHHTQFMAVQKVESTNLCSFYSNRNYTAQKRSWSLWIKWLNSQLRLIHKKET